MLTFAIYTFGCKVNQLESEALASAFRQAGFPLCAKTDCEDILIINTCTVTSKADQKARRIIRKTLRDNQDTCVLVTGCYAELDTEEIKALEGDIPGRGGQLFVFKGKEKHNLLDLPFYLKNAEKNDLPSFIKIWSEKISETSGHLFDEDYKPGYKPEIKPGYKPGNKHFFAPEQFSYHSRAFLKIQDGCDRQCSYCRVRLARGKSQSLEAELALKELIHLEEKGFAEVVLVGVNITEYRNDSVKDLAGLLGYLLSGTKKIALRLSSLEPDCIDENLIAVLSNKRIRPHFHLAVQSGSEKILKQMARSYSPETVTKAVALLRSVKKDPFLACDIITGFPGETDDDFQKTQTLCETIDFAWIHAFPYSKRPGTPAFSFPGDVCTSIVAKRNQILTNLAKKGKNTYTKRWIGSDIEVIIEKGTTENPSQVTGLSENYLKLLVNCSGKPEPGSLLRCRLLENAGSKKVQINDTDAVAEVI